MQTKFQLLYSIGKSVTRYNERTEDWSGDYQDFGMIEMNQRSKVFYPSNWNEKDMSEAIKDILKPYAPYDDDTTYVVQGGDGEYRTSRLEDADGDENPDGKYLADYTAFILVLPLPGIPTIDTLDYFGTGIIK